MSLDVDGAFVQKWVVPTGTGSMWESKWGHRSPSDCFFDDLAHVGQFSIVRPKRRSVVSHHRIDFVLCFGLNMWILDHGVDERQNCAGGGVCAALQQDPTQEFQLIPIEPQFFLLIEKIVKERLSIVGLQSALDNM